MCLTLNRWIRKGQLLTLTVLVVTATGVCAQDWTDYNQWVPSTNFPDMGTGWAGLNDPLNSWISFPTSSLNNSWITDPGFLQSLRVEHASMLTPTMSSASGYSMTSLASPLPSVNPSGNRSTLLQSVQTSSWPDYGLSALRTGRLAAFPFDAMIQASRQLTYPVFEQVAMARVQPQLVENQMWQQLNFVNQERLKVGQPRLSFEEYYSTSPSDPSARFTGIPPSAGGGMVSSPEDIEKLRQITGVVGFVRKACSETYPSLPLDLGVGALKLAPDILQDYENVLQGSYSGWGASHTLSGGAGLLYSKLMWDVGKSSLGIGRYMPWFRGLRKLAEMAGSYWGRGGQGPLTLREKTLVGDAFAITFTGAAFGPLVALAADVGLQPAREITMPAFQAGVNLFYKQRMAEQSRQQEINFNRNNELRLAQGTQPLSREEFLGSTPGQSGGFLNTLSSMFQAGNQAMFKMFESFEMARIQPQLVEQARQQDLNFLRNNQMRLDQGLRPLSREEFFHSTPGHARAFANQGLECIPLDFHNMTSHTINRSWWDRQGEGWKNSGYYFQERWTTIDPTRGMTTIRTMEKFRIKMFGADYGRPGRF